MPGVSWELGGPVTEPDGAGDHHASVHAPQPQLPAGTGVDKPHRVGAEPLDELRAAQVRRIGDLQYSPADPEQAARWQVRHAEVKIDVELIASQRHPVSPGCDKLSGSRVHHRHLPLPVG